MPTRARAAVRRFLAGSQPITYHGGAVMTGHVDVYVIWYGNWPATSKRRAIITDFLHNVPSPYWAINHTYANAGGTAVANDVSLSGETTDAYSVGKSQVTDDQIQTVVASAIRKHALPKNTHGIYLVVTSSDVEKVGFLTQYCGWHSNASIGGSSIKFAFIGDPTGPSRRNCTVQERSPNGDSGGDAMVSTIAHELDETVTDPTMNGWRTSMGEENADRCAWLYGKTYSAAGAAANMRLGSRQYLIQQNWLNSTQPHCALTP
jgi:hypothetical protein